MMKEKNFQSEFKKNNRMTGMFELKLCKGVSLPFSSVKRHQEEALLAATTMEGFYHKLADQPVSAIKGANVRFTLPKPFDCFLVKNTHAYVVIMFYVPRKKKMVYYVPIKSFLKMKDSSERKSMTESMLVRYAVLVKSWLKTRRTRFVMGDWFGQPKKK